MNVVLVVVRVIVVGKRFGWGYVAQARQVTILLIVIVDVRVTTFTWPLLEFIDNATRDGAHLIVEGEANG